jgi:hypothetical protein
VARPRKCFCGSCKRCRDADAKRRKYQGWTPEERRAWVERKDKVKLYLNRRKQRRIHALRHPDKVAARRAVAHALEAGRLKRLPCEVCGSTASQAHHDDYRFPLRVRWLCRQHHKDHEKIGGR